MVSDTISKQEVYDFLVKNDLVEKAADLGINPDKFNPDSWKAGTILGSSSGQDTHGLQRIYIYIKDMKGRWMEYGWYDGVAIKHVSYSEVVRRITAGGYKFTVISEGWPFG